LERRAREALKGIFAPIIRKRRETGVVEEDVLQSFIEARYRHVDGGRPLTEDEITGLLIAVLFAGQHTSSITSSWTGYCMLSHPVRPFPFSTPALSLQSVLPEELLHALPPRALFSLIL
jgi:cytochrome P450